MKKIILILFFFSLFNFAFPQSMDVTYETAYTLNAARPEKVKADRMILHVNKETSEFYSILRQNMDNLIARLEKQGVSYSDLLKEKSKIPDSSIYFRVYKNYSTKGQLTFLDIIGLTYYKYTEKLEKPIWKLSKDKKEIMGYSCQKATTHFRGRDWTAWFSTSIPVSDGPWKLWGLPGLILEASDSTNLYHFTAIGLKNVTATPITLYKKGNHAISCTKEQYVEQIQELLNNPTAMFSKQSGGSITIKSGDGKIAKSNRKYINIEIE